MSKKLQINTTGSSGEGIILKATDNTYPAFIGDANRSAYDTFLVALQGFWNGNRVGEITVESGSDTTNKDEGMVKIRTRNAGDSSPQDRLTVYHTGQTQIHSTTQSTSTTTGALRVDGGVGIAKNVYADNYFGNSGLTLNNNGNPSVSLTSTSTTGSSRINFGDPDSGVVGKIYYVHDGDYIHFNTAYNERLRITSSGDLSLRSTTQNAHLGLTANSTAINFTLGSTAGASPRMYFYGTGNGQSSAGDIFTGTGTGGILHYRSGGLIKFEVNSDNSTAEALRITSDGFVGINEDNPKTGLTIGKFGDYNNYDGNTYYMPVGKWASAWNAVNALESNIDYWVGFVGGYHKSGNSVNICLAPNRGNLSAQQGMYISGEATGPSTSDFTVGKIIGGSALGQGTSGNVRATKSELFRITSGGNIGINRSNPTRTLHISSDDDLTSFTGTGYGTVAVENSQYDSGDYNAIDFTYSSSNSPVARIAAKIAGGGSSLHFGTSNNYSSGITNETFRIGTSGKVAFASVKETGNQNVHNVSTADVEIGGRHIWKRITSGNHVTTSSGVNHFYLAFFRNNNGNQNTCYFRGVVVNVIAGGNYDWSGHGYVTHSSQTILSFHSTTGGVSNTVYNQGHNSIHNNSTNMRVQGVGFSYDSNYLYTNFRFHTNLSGTGFKPHYNVEVIDPSQCTYTCVAF